MLWRPLLKKGQSVRAVVRNSFKAQEVKDRGIEVTIADYFDLQALKKLFMEEIQFFS